MKISKIYHYLILVIIFTIPLFSEEVPEQKEEITPKKKFGIILRRQNTILSPYETKRIKELYPPYYGKTNDVAEGNFYLGFKYYLPRENWRLEGNLNEIRKADISKYLNYCINGNSSACYPSPVSVGSYYRFTSETLIYRDFYKYFSFGGGLKYLQSNLSFSNPFTYHSTFKHNSLGGLISLKMKTPTFYGFHLEYKINAYYLLGKMGLEIGVVDKIYYRGGNNLQNKVGSRTIGIDSDILIGFSITDNFILSIGTVYSEAYVYPKTKFITSTEYDYSRDIYYNFYSTARNNYKESFESKYIQVTALF